MVNRKKPGIDKDIAKLGAGRKQLPDNYMGSRPGQMHSETLTAGRAGYGRVGGGPAMDTIYAGHPGSRARLMATVYGGYTGSRLPVMDSVYGGHPGSMRQVMETVYGGDPGSRLPSANTVFAPRHGVSQIQTRQITNPFNRQPETVSYNTVTGLYLDKSLNRWLPAPPWISAQFRR